MTHPHRLAPLLGALLVALLGSAFPACTPSGGDDASAAAPTARIAATGVMGEYRGTLQRGEETVTDHVVEVLTDTDGSPMVSIADFCSLQMRGAGPEYQADPDQRCLVNLGDGQRARAATGSANIADGRIRATVQFPDDDVTWTFEGQR